MNRQIIFVLVSLFTAIPLFSQKYVAGHEEAKEEVLRSIPEQYINKARNDFHLAFQRTSHGSHTSFGVFGLPDYKAGDETLFAVSTETEAGKLEFRDQALFWHTPKGYDYNHDLARPDETLFVQTTRNFLDDPYFAHINIIMWAWCNIENREIAANYLPGMETLMSEYGPGGTMIGTGPGMREVPVYFIFMTGHPNTGLNLGPGNPEQQAALITAHCQANDYFCLDYYSIDSHDMSDQYWNDVGDNGQSTSYGGNFYEDWQGSHVLGTDYFENRETPGGVVNFGDHLSQHITSNRKAYALWWILARMAGWSGASASIPVEEITVSSVGGVDKISKGEHLQMLAEILPVNASNKEIIWSVTDQSGSATINQDGNLTAVSAGTALVEAAALDGSEITGSLQITITDAVVPVASITVSSPGGTSVLTNGESIQLDAEILPENATNKSIEWSVSNVTGSASISPSGLLTGLASGTITVEAAALDGSGAKDSMIINVITSPEVLVSSIQLTSEHGITQIYTEQTLQFFAEVLPADATNSTLYWSVENLGDGYGVISPQGLFAAVSSGEVNVIASAKDGSGVSDTILLTIEDSISIASIEISIEGGGVQVPVGEVVQCLVKIEPASAASQEVTWSVYHITGEASISFYGVLTAVSTGIVGVVASGCGCTDVADTLEIEITSPLSLRVPEDEKFSEIKLYPNPGSGLFHLDPGSLALSLIEVIDPSGHIVKQENPGKGSLPLSLDMNGYPAGYYLLRMHFDGEIVYRKLIIY